MDANAFDPETNYAFASCGEGLLTIVHEDSPEKYSVVANVPTQKGARTMALDEKTHRVSTVTANFGPRLRPLPITRTRGVLFCPIPLCY